MLKLVPVSLQVVLMPSGLNAVLRAGGDATHTANGVSAVGVVIIRRSGNATGGSGRP